MDFLELAKSRYSCRSFDPSKEVEKEKLDKILEAGRVAPTAKNAQEQRILVVDTRKDKEKLEQITPFGWGAPVMLIISFDKNESYKQSVVGFDFGYMDASIVTTHMILEAQTLGLGTTWVGMFDPIKAKELYNIPESYEVVSLLPIGYPSEEAHPSKMHSAIRPKEETIFYDTF